MAAYDRWEYLFVHIGHSRGFHEVSWRPYMINGEKLPQWQKGPRWQDFFHQMGKEGWEFVTFDSDFLDYPVAGGKLAIFKRQKKVYPDQQKSKGRTAPFISDS